MTDIIAVANYSDGVVKTTTVVSLAEALAQHARDVLLVDLDPKARLSQALGIAPDTQRTSVADIFLGTETVYRLSRPTRIPGVDIIPAGQAMEMVEHFLPARDNYQNILRRAFNGSTAPAEGAGSPPGKHSMLYDVVILDCPSFTGSITYNALQAAHLLVIPTRADSSAIPGIENTLSGFARGHANGNPGISYRILACVPHQAEPSNGANIADIYATYSDRVFQHWIESDGQLAAGQEAWPSHQSDSLPSSSARQYAAVAAELLQLLSPTPAAILESDPPEEPETLACEDAGENALRQPDQAVTQEYLVATENAADRIGLVFPPQIEPTTGDIILEKPGVPLSSAPVVSVPAPSPRPKQSVFQVIADRVRNASPSSVALLYLGLLTLAELMVTYTDPRVGLALHGFILVTILLQASFVRKGVMGRFLFSLALAPLIRLMSLSLPLPKFPPVYWYAVVGLPLMLAAFVSLRICQVNNRMVGFTRRNLINQVIIGTTGIGLGGLEYMILRPEPLVDEFRFGVIIVPALILLIFTGFLEEFIFRGVMQYTALVNFGWKGLIYISLVFAVLHVGYRSLLDVFFVFMVALIFGFFSLKTNSILGVTIAHGLTNIGLFLVFPFLLGP